MICFVCHLPPLPTRSRMPCGDSSGMLFGFSVCRLFTCIHSMFHFYTSLFMYGCMGSRVRVSLLFVRSSAFFHLYRAERSALFVRIVHTHTLIETDGRTEKRMYSHTSSDARERTAPPNKIKTSRKRRGKYKEKLVCVVLVCLCSFLHEAGGRADRRRPRHDREAVDGYPPPNEPGGHGTEHR